MSLLKIPLAALCICAGLSQAADAATLSYAVTARFDGDAPLELVRPGGTSCYDDSCLPAGYRLPAALGGIWSDLAPGDTITALFSFEGLRPGGQPKSGSCLIAGFSDCGEPLAFDAFDETTGRVRAVFSRSAPTSSLVLDLTRNRISYEGEAGSYAPSSCTEAAPIYSGLPLGYCNFFGYRADFTVTDFEALPTVVPAPLSSLLLLSGIGVFVAAGKARRKRRDRPQT